MRSSVRLWRLTILSGGVVFLLHLAAAQASVQPAKIAFVANREGNWDVFVANADGSDPVQLTRTPYDENEPRWSPDRKQIVCSATDGRAYLIDVNSGRMEELAAEDEAGKKTSPCFSPDGRKVVYVRFKDKTADDSELVIFDLASRTERVLIDQPGPQLDPDWSPDGRHIVYTTVHCNAGCGRIIQELWLAGVEGGYARQVLMTNALCTRPRWSPDGRHIAFCCDKEGSLDIWTVSVDDWMLKAVTTDANLEMSPAWSADGGRLAFTAAKAGRMQIWMKDLRSGNIERIKPFAEENVECRDVTW